MSHAPVTAASVGAFPNEDGAAFALAPAPGWASVVNRNDIWLTPDAIARDVVHHFRPAGRVLDPCKGEGAFLNHMPGAEWCEIREGRDFYAWCAPVDWIVSNPPYSIFTDFHSHALRLAQNVVWLMPLHKPFGSWQRMEELFAWGGIREIRIYGKSRDYGLDVGFVCGAVHYQRGWFGPTFWSRYSPNNGGLPCVGRARPLARLRSTPEQHSHWR